MGLPLAELLHGPAGLDAPPAATVDPGQATLSMLVLFSIFTLTDCRLRADGGGRSPKSFENTQCFSVSSFHGIIMTLGDQLYGIYRADAYGDVYIIKLLSPKYIQIHLFVCVQEKTE